MIYVNNYAIALYKRYAGQLEIESFPDSQLYTQWLTSPLVEINGVVSINFDDAAIRLIGALSRSNQIKPISPAEVSEYEISNSFHASLAFDERCPSGIQFIKTLKVLEAMLDWVRAWGMGDEFVYYTFSDSSYVGEFRAYTGLDIDTNAIKVFRVRENDVSAQEFRMICLANARQLRADCAIVAIDFSEYKDAESIFDVLVGRRS